jgi:DNA-binding transcriptional MerR regulator/methylmalonyl-CoA mutase cobalamin-binding subunit
MLDDKSPQLEVRVAEQHPIQVVVRRTGLSADVLRAWERRYGVVEPARSPTGRRLYSDDDIERLRLLHRAVRGGRSIGQVSGFSTAELRELIREDESEAVQPPDRRHEVHAGASGVVADCLIAVDHLDAAGLEDKLTRTGAAFGATVLLEGVVVPLLEVVGNRWVAEDYTIAHEHMASAVVRQVVGRMLSGSTTDAARPLALFAAPAGEHHELGALMAAAVAALEDWRVVYLGADLPAQDLGHAIATHRPRIVALSVVSPESATTLASQVAELKDRLPPDTTLLVGGRAAERHWDSLERLGAVRVQGLSGLRDLLVSMGTGTRQHG